MTKWIATACRIIFELNFDWYATAARRERWETSPNKFQRRVLRSGKEAGIYSRRRRLALSDAAKTAAMQQRIPGVCTWGWAHRSAILTLICDSRSFFFLTRMYTPRCVSWRSLIPRSPRISTRESIDTNHRWIGESWFPFSPLINAVGSDAVSAMTPNASRKRAGIRCLSRV